jgi:hypothetical protein
VASAFVRADRCERLARQRDPGGGRQWRPQLERIALGDGQSTARLELLQPPLRGTGDEPRNRSPSIGHLDRLPAELRGGSDWSAGGARGCRWSAGTAARPGSGVAGARAARRHPARSPMRSSPRSRGCRRRSRPTATFFRSVSGAMMASGRVTSADIEQAIALSDDPGFGFVSQITTAARGPSPRRRLIGRTSSSPAPPAVQAAPEYAGARTCVACLPTWDGRSW